MKKLKVPISAWRVNISAEHLVPIATRKKISSFFFAPKRTRSTDGNAGVGVFLLCIGDNSKEKSTNATQRLLDSLGRKVEIVRRSRHGGAEIVFVLIRLWLGTQFASAWAALVGQESTRQKARTRHCLALSLLFTFGCSVAKWGVGCIYALWV